MMLCNLNNPFEVFFLKKVWSYKMLINDFLYFQLRMNKPHLLSNLWETYTEQYTRDRQQMIPNAVISKYVSELMSLGPFYCYVLDLFDSSIYNVHENTCNILGMDSHPASVSEIMSHIHPDDLAYVMAAEKACLDKILEIGFEHLRYLKVSYCFRMKVADGSYHLFRHQSIHLSADEKGRLAMALNIHTDIEHITSINNHIVVVNGIGKRNDFYQIDLSAKQSAESISPNFSKREREVLVLIVAGFSSLQIAEQLFVSVETVRVHRRNILKKTNCNNSSSLVRRCLEQSWC